MTKVTTKRILAGVISVLCAAGVVTAQPSFGGAAADTAVVASAAEISGDYKYKLLDDGTAEITEYNGTDEVLEIPSEIAGYTVTSIGEDAFYNCESLTSVTIPDSVTLIGKFAFVGCSSLASVTIPDSVTSIGEYAFSSCESLESVTIPDSVTSIGWDAFYDCTSLKTVNIPETVTDIGGQAFTNTPWLNEKIKDAPLVVVNNILIDGSTATGDVVIPDTVTKISDDAFCQNTNITSVTIPGSVSYISNSAFGFCTSLESVTIQDGVTSIGHGAFINCNSLEAVTIPDSVTSINVQAFEGCLVLKSVTLPENLTVLGEGAFIGCKSLKSIDIPDSITSIADNVFNWCTKLESVTIPDSVTKIGWNAFFCCTSLESINIPESVTEIGGNAFENTKWIENKRAESPLVVVNSILIDGKAAAGEVIIPDDVTKIYDIAFKDNNDIVSVTIPDNVTSIGYGAFQNCTSLESVSIPNSITMIDGFTFAGCSYLKSVVFPDSVTSIGDRAFIECLALESVTIPNSVTSIGLETFFDCPEIKSVTIPNSVTEIGYDAFGYFIDPKIFKGGKVEDFKIYCYPGTAGEEYATDNRFAYELLDEVRHNPTITYQKGDGAVKLSWTEVKGAESYAVVEYDNGSWTKVTEVTETSCILRKLTSGKKYKVAVLAKVNGEWLRDISNAIIVTPNESAYPVAKVKVQGRAFKLSWTAVQNARGYAVAYTANGKTWKLAKTAGVNTTSFTCTNAPKGTYYLVVCAKMNGKYDTSNLMKRAVKVVIK